MYTLRKALKIVRPMAKQCGVTDKELKALLKEYKMRTFWIVMIYVATLAFLVVIGIGIYMTGGAN